MAGKQNHGERWDADAMIKNAKALRAERVVKELEKNKPKPSLSDGWGKWDRGTEDQLLFRRAGFWRFPIYCRSRQSSR